jgi:uncharacterized damage-inducible protein DinB
MSETASLLPALLDAWDRNNLILLNLLRMMPEGGLGVRTLDDGPTVAQQLTHLYAVRLSLVEENAPECAPILPPDLRPTEEWDNERDAAQLERMLNASAGAVRGAVQGRILAGQEMDLHYDHPLLLIQHLIWHEGYHHGQIKLALKRAGHPIADRDAGPLTWGVWMNKEPL